MGSRSADEEYASDKQHQESTRRPLYTVRQPPLIQPLRLSSFTERTCTRLGIPPDDLAHEWVVLFQAISGEENGRRDATPDSRYGLAQPKRVRHGKFKPSPELVQQNSDKLRLSERRQPSVWYTTSSAGRVKIKDLMVRLAELLSSKSRFAKLSYLLQLCSVSRRKQFLKLSRLHYLIDGIRLPVRMMQWLCVV